MRTGGPGRLVGLVGGRVGRIGAPGKHIPHNIFLNKQRKDTLISYGYLLKMLKAADICEF